MPETETPKDRLLVDVSTMHGHPAQGDLRAWTWRDESQSATPVYGV